MGELVNIDTSPELIQLQTQAQAQSAQAADTVSNSSATEVSSINGQRGDLTFSAAAASHGLQASISVGAGTVQVGITVANFLDLTTGLKVAGTQVVAARRTGWTAATGTKTRTTFDAATATLPDIGERLAALLDDLISHGLIGP